jgi:hypothetical protein
MKNNYKINKLEKNNFEEGQNERYEGRAAYLNIINNNNINNNTIVDLDKNTDVTVEENEKAFIEFWNVYPRKDSKKRAREIFLRKKLHNHVEMILADLRNRKAWDGGKYTPLPSTYLSQERWHDETRGEINDSPTYQRINSNANQREQLYDYLIGKNPNGLSNEIQLNPALPEHHSENGEN